MARILGLDLGSASLKGVMLETNLRGFTTRGFAEVALPEGTDRLERLKAAVPQLLAQVGPADTVVVALPGPMVATHQLSLPFNETKKIEAALGFEVESQLPFDLDEAVFDYQIGATEPTGSQILVGVVKKTELATLLDALKEAKLEPRVVTHPAIAYQNVLGTLPAELLPQDPEAAVAIIDIGHERTCVAVGRPGQGVEQARTFPGGGLNITKAIAQAQGLSMSDAQAFKELRAAVGPAADGLEHERGTLAVLKGLAPLVRELRPTLKAYTARTRRPVERVLICGGTARLAGLAEQLERDLGVPVALLPLPREVAEAVPPDAHAAAAQASALALRGQASGAKAPRFNLRRGEFSFKSDIDFVREKAGQLITFGVVLLVLLIAGGIVRNTVLERREKQLDAMLCDVTTKILGKCEKDFLRATSMMEGKDSAAAGLPKRSAVSLLAELTSRIPPEMKVTMDQIVIDLDRISLRCETGNSKQVEELMAALRTYKCFSNVKEGKVEKSKDGSKVTFRLDVQVQCPDEDKPAT